ncbi:NAC domain-containing protein 53-like [Olea europaea var. sylvestris]|uniref:NAC domain-containing protein 53-like n=1 Tax=Olea europaea var. sylvestris TaxID=158386 RepID=UPI000C1D40D1|nr:NAC domain-containing protein 53-like [Olea europaea var. sylvestris]
MDSTPNKSSSGSSSTLLAPGFRFHPTDEELVRYYLRRKVCGKSFRFDAISDIDIYKAEPWDLPSMSRLKTRDSEWYFFSILDKKYGNGSKTNRATEKGYWKTTGKDRAVYHKSVIIGMKKTLVYHSGRAPKGMRTNWVMHEYRLVDLELERAGIIQDAFVLCRVFQKSGSGPKNGEKYGAPFVEEEWEDDEVEMATKEEAAEEVDFGGDAYLDGHDLEQILGTDVTSDVTTFPLNFYSVEDGSNGKESTTVDSQKLLLGVPKYQCEPEQSDDKKLCDIPDSYDVDGKLLKHEYIGESSKTGNSEVDYLLDETWLDAFDNIQSDDGGFIETNDLFNSVGDDTSTFDMLEEYLTFFDAEDGNSQYFAYNPSKMMGNEDLVSDEAFLVQKTINEPTQQDTTSSRQTFDNNNDSDAEPSPKNESAKFESDFQHPLMKQANNILGSISAPPAFASEIYPKDAALRFNSVAQSSSSAHITAGMVQLRNLTMGGNGADNSFGKLGNLNIVLSFGLSQGSHGSTSLESSVILPEKTVSAISRGWYYIFLWVLILSMSFKIGTYICAR